MKTTVSIAIDAMSGDAGAPVIVDAVVGFLKKTDDVHLLLVGDQPLLESLLEKHNFSESQVSVIGASEVVTMEDSASVALRQKKDSSMRVAINLVKEGKAKAAVSAGNTGALLAISKFVLKTLPGIDRPAICTALPAIDGHTHMLDLGANVDCTADHLLQFAVMGSTLTNAVDNISRPKVGLLNIGSEELKGNDQIRQAAGLLSASDLNYIGFVEGDEIYTPKVDVVVSDGFAGNISLKSSEGLAKTVSHYLREEFQRTPWNKLIGLLAMPILKSFRSRIDPRKYNGASLLGLRGVVIKSHGSADAFAFANALEIARLEAQQDVPNMIGSQVGQLLPTAAPKDTHSA